MSRRRMSSKLDGITISVIGGDDREKYLIKELFNLGVRIKIIGMPYVGQHERVEHCTNLCEAVRGASFIILPMPGIDQTGKVRAIYSPEPLIFNEIVMEAMDPNAVIFVGVAKPRLKELAENRKLKLIELADNDEVAILNSIPSAEGAIQMAMEETTITIHGSDSVVLGFGRTGKTLARLLAAMGAKVTVLARKQADLARAYEMGFKALTYLQLGESLSTADVVYNTVPVMVLNGDALKDAKPNMVIIDLASAPGGTDFQAAEKLGINAKLAPGLPGKVAPKTAGIILAKVIPGLMEKELSLTASMPYDGLGN